MPTLTYHEIASVRGISLASARKYAQKKRWPRVLGNDGQARVQVPDDAEIAATVKDTPIPTDSPTVDPILVATLETQISGLKELVESERRRADAEQRRAADLEKDRDAWREIATANAGKGLFRRLFG